MTEEYKYHESTPEEQEEGAKLLLRAALAALKDFDAQTQDYKVLVRQILQAFQAAQLAKQQEVKRLEAAYGMRAYVSVDIAHIVASALASHEQNFSDVHPYSVAGAGIGAFAFAVVILHVRSQYEGALDCELYGEDLASDALTDLKTG